MATPRKERPGDRRHAGSEPRAETRAQRDERYRCEASRKPSMIEERRWRGGGIVGDRPTD